MKGFFLMRVEQIQSFIGFTGLYEELNNEGGMRGFYLQYNFTLLSFEQILLLLQWGSFYRD